jgi:hypothetical protein
MEKKKPTKSAIQKQILILCGCLALAILLLVLIPSKATVKAKPNELESHERISSLADDYMLARNEQERQMAARRIRSERAGRTSLGSHGVEQAFLFLRIVLVITIVVLAWKTIALARRATKMRSAPQT